MRDYALSRAASFGELSSSWLSRLFRNWKARKHVASLEQYDDVLLRDIGLTRDEVQWASHLPLSQNAALALEDRAFRRRRESETGRRPGWGVY